MSDSLGFERIIGQELAKQVLMRAVRENEPTHAYLFLGLEGTGKLRTALEFAKSLNCLEPVDGNACEHCVMCSMIEHGNFPDIRVWSPDGQNTKIDQMREMRDLAVFRPMRGKWKINIIEQGDTLNEESANCILKLLEEPPEYLINIILYRNAAGILPTIRSRCQLIRFTQVNTTELSQRLSQDYNVNLEDAEFLSSFSQGRPGIAIDLIGNDEFLRKRDSILKVADAASAGDMWTALKLAEILRASGSVEQTDDDENSDDGTKAQHKAGKKKSARDVVIESLDILLVWYRDLLSAKLCGEDAAIVNFDKTDNINKQCGRYPHAGRILNGIEAILHAKRAIIGNANTQITTEALMMHLMAQASH